MGQRAPFEHSARGLRERWHAETVSAACGPPTLYPRRHAGRRLSRLRTVAAGGTDRGSLMVIRDAVPADLADIARFFREIVSAGETYAYPEHLDDRGIADLWMVGAPGRCSVAVDSDGAVIGSATMGPNRPGRGAHIATASFMVDPAAQGRGIGRALGAEAVRWARDQGFHGMQFNAVVETNAAAVHLWQDLGFRIMTTIPDAFEHSQHGRVGLHVMYRRL